MQRLRLIALAGFVLGVSASFLEACGPAKCACLTGCCDDKGACQAGTEASMCGRVGTACQACVGAQLCLQNVCTVGALIDAGVDGGTDAGMDAGTGDGGVCGSVRAFTMPFQPATVAQVRWDLEAADRVWNRVRFNADLNGGVYVYAQVYFDPTNTPMLPLIKTFSPGFSYNDAQFTGAVVGLSDCDTAGSCAARYLAQAGTATFSVLGAETAGRMAGAASSVLLVEWNYAVDDNGMVTADAPVANARCLEVAGLSYDLTYTAGAAGSTLATYDAGQ